MKCPNNHDSFQEIKIGNVKVDRCSQCEGLWFNRDELRLAKDAQDEYTDWFDLDLWQDEKAFTTAQSSKLCPVDQVALYAINYGDSGIKIDACRKCQGIWLDKDEFKRIVDFVQKKASYDLLHNYTKSLVQEGKEIFTGPESLRSEVDDFLMVVNLFQFKVVANPALIQTLMNLPLSK